MDKTVTTEDISLNDLLLSASLTTETTDYLPMISDDLSTINEQVTDEERLISSVAALLVNLDEDEENNGFNKSMIQGLIHRVDSIINEQVNEVLHAPEFQRLESTWCSIDDLVKNTNFRANIKIDLFDAEKDEIAEDFECNSSDMTGSALFKKVYTEEYDQYGGEPYGSVIGLYEFEHTPKNIEWLKNMSKLAAASHAPFTASVGPQLFWL
ncbi:type VI secretion system contractile sheath domain-containing protein [Piscirickettsia litoralis]|uniref:type VI secretion system contractile sheath domain-containing protein n=1 Tax=Piscirickettsia litoralis TaxID=1891921 RepID=UPI000AF39D73|nr:type VI secretion system contractile sheath large subunit [Piscirickettsia litoralis]